MKHIIQNTVNNFLAYQPIFSNNLKPYRFFNIIQQNLVYNPITRQEWVIKNFLPDLSHTYREDNDQHQEISQDVIQSISHSSLGKFSMTLLVYSLLCDHNLDLENKKQNNSWVYQILKNFPSSQHQDIATQYNQLRESKFIQQMRENYIANGQLKDDYTYFKVMEEMFSIEYKNISGFDKFCHFFAYIIKGIMYMMGKEYQSTKDIKEEYNSTVELILNQDTDNSWRKFAANYKSEIETKLYLN